MDWAGEGAISQVVNGLSREIAWDKAKTRAELYAGIFHFVFPLWIYGFVHSPKKQ